MKKINELNDVNQLDSDLLRTFLAVVETGGISNAGERVFRSQSAVSIQIKRLEQLVGQPVFDRNGRGVILNAVGEALLPNARMIVRLLDETYREIKPIQLNGTLRIGIPDEYGDTILPQMLAGFSKKHPNVLLTVTCSLSAYFSEALERNELDVAIFNIETPESGHEIIRRQRPSWITSRKHSVHKQIPVPIALFDRNCWWRDEAIKALDLSRMNYRIAYSSESVHGIVAAIRAGIAVGLINMDKKHPEFLRLGKSHGFPVMPSSALVLARRESVDVKFTTAILEATRAAFGD